MITKLLKSVREYKTPSILCPVLMVGEAAMEIVIPYFMTFIIGELESLSKGLTESVNVRNMIIYFSLMVLCAVFALICGVWGAKLSARAASGFAHNLRQDMYDNIQRYSFANIDKYSTASLITRITTDVANVQNAYQMCIRMLVRAPILFVSAIVMTCLIEPTMAVIFIGGAIILGLIVFVCMFRVIPHFKMMFKKYDDLNSVVQENLTAIRVVKSYVREEQEIKKMNAATAEVYKYSVKAEKILTFLMPAVSVVMYATIITIFTVGSNMSVGNLPGNVTAADLQTLNVYAMQILSGVIMVAMCLNFISLSRGSMERICEVLDEKPTLTAPQAAVTEVADGSVSFENVDFAYAERPADGLLLSSADNEDGDESVLTGINLKINSGETVGVIGATGSGKTSLVSLIPRLYDVTSGSVKVGGVDVRDYDMDALRNKVAMVLQKNVLFSGTVAENLRWGDENATDEELRLAARQACAEEFIDALPGGYEYDLGQGGVNVSGGQKQRLCIARALLKKPKVIIFDDSTSAVDTKTDAVIRESLKKHAPETTKIIIAQRIASVQDADKIIVLDDGKVSAVGNHEELLKNNAIYREIYFSQSGGQDNGLGGEINE